MWYHKLSLKVIKSYVWVFGTYSEPQRQAYGTYDKKGYFISLTMAFLAPTGKSIFLTVICLVGTTPRTAEASSAWPRPQVQSLQHRDRHLFLQRTAEALKAMCRFATQGESSEGGVLAASDRCHCAALGKLPCPEEGALLVQEVACRSHRTFRGFWGGLRQVTGGLEGHSLGSKDTFTTN